MFPHAAALALPLVLDVAVLVKRYGGLPGILTAERKTVAAVRVTIRDWKAAKAAGSAGGKQITFDEAKVIAADILAAIEDAVGPLLNVPAGTDPAAFGEDLAGVVLPIVFRWLTGMKWDAVVAALNPPTTATSAAG